jgi:hypothetical protein
MGAQPIKPETHMKHIGALLFAIAILATPAIAGTDYTCVSDCTAKGYMYNYCTSRCSYDDNSRGSSWGEESRPRRQQPQTDYSCMSDCTSRYMYDYCKQKCSY